MARVLVTGGAGYVGAHICAALAAADHQVIVFDNLSNGHAEFVKWGAFEEGDIRNAPRVRAVLEGHRPNAVVHCAGLIEAGVSTRDPAAFYDQNVTGSLVVMDAMRAAGLDNLIFSSTCATFGAPQSLPMDETHPQAPLNPYGWSKLMVERACRDYGAAYGFKCALLRYFNAAGAAPELGIGEWHEPESHVIPLALETLRGQGVFKIFGDDYATRDGTCLRDYVHVLDLAAAHVSAVERLIGGGDSLAVNLGSGEGVTILELIAAIERVTGRALTAERAARRPGDAPALVADNAFARRELGWTPTRSLDDIIRSAWTWHCR